MIQQETLFCPAGVEIVARPYLAGDELSQLAQKCSETWVERLVASGLVDPSVETPTSLEILNGGKFYYVQSAWNAVFQKGDESGSTSAKTTTPCQVLKLRARRGHASASTSGGPAHNDQGLAPGMELFRLNSLASPNAPAPSASDGGPSSNGRGDVADPQDPSSSSDWCVRLWDFDGDFTAFNGPILVGDTIATGTTLIGVLGWLFAKMEACGGVQSIHVFTIVGAKEWKKAPASPSPSLASLSEKLADIDAGLRKHGKQLSITFANATFGLAANGTDLSPAPQLGASWDEVAFGQLRSIVEASAAEGAEGSGEAQDSSVKPGKTTSTANSGDSVKLSAGGFDDFLLDMKCGVWDWGDRFTKAASHLREIEEHYEAVLTGLEADTTRATLLQPQQDPLRGFRIAYATGVLAATRQRLVALADDKASPK